MTGMHVKDMVCAVLFVSSLQPSDVLTAETVAYEIGNTVRCLSAAECACRVAEEFGSHPQEAADRMRWIRQLTDTHLQGCRCLSAALASTAGREPGLRLARNAA
jgi:hypothetical protein